MKKKNRSTPFLMILVLSIIATQLSLKAFGVNITPSLGTVIESWGKVAGVIGCVYHPGLVAELDALSNHFLITDGNVPLETGEFRGELACNKGADFDLTPPPLIDVNDPSVTIEEPVQESCLKTINRRPLRKETFDIEKLDLEVLQIAIESDGESTAEETKPEAKEESIRSIAVGVAADDPEPENKTLTPQFEDKIFVRLEDFLEAPKPTTNKKPCPELEKLRKLEETRKLFDEYQNDSDGHFVNHIRLPLEFQAAMTKVNLEKAKRVRVIIRRNPLALPRTPQPDSFEFLAGP